MTGAQVIRAARLKAGLTQAEVAARMGRERAQIARWEIGGQEPSFENVRAVVEACGFTLEVEIADRAETPELDAELKASLLQAPQQRVHAAHRPIDRPQVTARDSFDPYALLAALEGARVSFVVIGGFARVVHGSAELTKGLDVVPSLREENLRRLQVVVDELDARGADNRTRVAVDALERAEVVRARTGAGDLRLVAAPWGTRGYDDLRIRANRENLGRGARPAVASLPDLVRMLEASRRVEDGIRLERLRRLMELENQLVRSKRLTRGRSLDLGR